MKNQMKKIALPNVTLVAVTGVKIFETIRALHVSSQDIDFGKIKLIAPEKTKYFPKNMIFEKSPEMNSLREYSEYVFIHLDEHIDTDYCLLIQHDSWVLNPGLWKDEWLEYDYIGAPWAVKDDAYIAWGTGEHVRVGNGGFSLRSKKLLGIPKLKSLPLTHEQGYYNEDGNICCYYRTEFLESGIKFAPVEVAARFSYETSVRENLHINPFGFHKHFPPYIGF